MSDFDAGKSWADYVAQHPEQFKQPAAPAQPTQGGNQGTGGQNQPPVMTGPDGNQYQFDQRSWDVMQNEQAKQKTREDWQQQMEVKWLGESTHNDQSQAQAAPGYQPGYWDKPRNVASAYYQIKAAPPGTAPDWATTDVSSAVTQLYDYMKQQNPGKPWYEWDYLPQDDPVREITQTLPGLDASQPAATGTTGTTTPSAAGGATPITIPQATLDELRAAKPEDLATLPDDVVGMLPGDLQTMVKQAKTQPVQAYTPGATPQLINGMPAEDWNKLPKSEQLMYAILPAVGKALGPVAGAVGGFGMAGPVGAVAGAAAMAGAQAAAQQSEGRDVAAEMAKGAGSTVGLNQGGFTPGIDTIGQAITEIFNALQWSAQTAEKVFGVMDQFYGESIQATKQGGIMAGADAVVDVLKHLPEAYQAGALDYESNVGPAYRPEESAGSTVGLNQPGAQPVVYGWQTDAQGKQEMLVTPWTPELRTQTMQEARQRIIGGEKVSDVMTDIGARFGIRGQVRDMEMQMALDPLNLIPAVGEAAAVKVLGTSAKAAETAGELGKAAELGKWTEAVEKEGNFMIATRRLGVEVRAMPVEQTKNFSAFTKWVSGLDKAGELKIYQTGNAMTLGERVSGALFQPTPQARAWAMLGNASNALDPVMPMSEDPLVNAAKFKQIAAKDPALAVAADQASGLPKYWDSAEAQPLPLAMREATDDVDAIAQGFANKGSQAKRAVIGKLAQVIEGDGYEAGKSEFKLIKGLAEGDEAHANAVARQLKNAATQTGAAGLNDLTGKQLKALVDPYYKGELDFTPEQANAKMKYAILSAVDKYSVTSFGVKPNPWLVRFADAIKRAQSRIVLGLNPVYPLNNAINNLITLAYDGNLGNFSGKASDEWWTAMEMDPMKGHQGMGSGGDFAGLQAQGKMKNQAAQVGEAVMAAGKAKPTGNALTDLPETITKAVSGAPELTPTSEWSATLEKAQSMQAMTTAAKRYWFQEWPKMVESGATQMSAQLKGVLDLVKPGLADEVTKAIKAGVSQADIERTVFKDLGRKSLAKTMVPEDLAMLKAHFPAAVDELDKALGKAETDGEVAKAFQDLRVKMAKQVAAEKAKGMAAQTQAFVERIQGEGVQAVVDIRHDLAAKRADLHIETQKRLEEAFATANKLPGAERRAYLDKELAAIDDLWNGFQSDEHAGWLAMTRAVGTKDPEYNQALLALQDVHDSWRNFFQTRSQEARQIYINMEGGVYEDDLAVQTAWDEFNNKMDQMYADATGLESDSLNQFHEIFANSFETQFPGGKADALAWWKKPQAARAEIEESVKYFRSLKGNPSAETKALVDDILDRTASGKPTRMMTSYERTAAWKRFNAEVYQPLVRQELDAIHGGSKDVLRGPATGSVQPSILDQTAGDRRVTTEAERNAWLAKHDQTGLTRLKNRVAFDEDFTAAKTAGKNPKVAYWDLRGLKSTNDNFGHAAGDAYLQAMEKAMQDEGLGDKGYRMGGDEFAALFDSPEQAQAAMQRVMNRFESGIIEVRYEDGTIKRFSGARAHFGIGDSTESADRASGAAKTAAGFGNGRDYQLTELGTESGERANVPAAQGLEADAQGGSGAAGADQTAAQKAKLSSTSPQSTKDLTRAQLAAQTSMRNDDGSFNLRWLLYNDDLSQVPEPIVQDLKITANTMADTAADYERRNWNRETNEWTAGHGAGGWMGQWLQKLRDNGRQPPSIGEVKAVLHAWGEGNPARSPTGMVMRAKWVDDLRYEVYKRLGGSADIGTEGQNPRLFWLSGDKDHTVEQFVQALDEYDQKGWDSQGLMDTLFGEDAGKFSEYYVDYMERTFGNVQSPETLAEQMRASGQVAVDGQGKVHTAAELDASAEVKRSTVRKILHDRLPAELYPAGADKHMLNVINESQRTRGQAEFKELADVTPEAARAAADFRMGKHLTPAQVNEARAGKVEEIAKQLEAEQGSVSIETGPALKAYLEQKGRAGKYAQATIDNMLNELEKAVNEKRPLSIIENEAEQAAFKEVAEKNGYQLGEWVKTERHNNMQATVVKGGKRTSIPESAPAGNGLVGSETPPTTTQVGETTIPVESVTAPTEPPVAMRAPLGSAEGEAPVLNAQAEGWVSQALPALDRAEQGMLGDQAHAWGAFDMEKELPPEAAAQLRAYLSGVVQPAMADTKYKMLQYATQARDMSLLDYTRRMGFDNWLGTVFPYQFWYTRSMLNWGLRVLSRPAIAANYARLTSLNDKYSNRVQTPTRLQHKVGIPFPYLPDGWGDTVYIDPLKQAFPFAQMLRPFETESDNQNMLAKKTQGYLQDMVDAEEITQAQADQALQTQQGSVFEQALAQAQEDMDNMVTNPMSGETATTGGFRNATDAIDFASTIVGLSLPLQMAYYWNTGRKDRISQMPITRLVQNATGALGMKGGQGYNLEGMVRGAAGMPAVSSLDEYYIDRELANLTADGKISAQDAMDAMASKQGAAYQQATQQVRAQGLMKQFGAPLGVDVYPEGEAESRALQGEYDKVAAAAAAGDTKAWNAFYAAHPEASVRSLSYKSTQPEVLMQKFLASAIWDRYNGLNPLDKKQAADQLGTLFQDAFLNKATRSYDSISNDTLVQWAQMMDAHLPTGIGGAQQGKVTFTDPAVSQAYQGYLDEKQAKFAGIDTLLNVYYGLDANTQQPAFEAQHPEVGKYLDWRTTYLAAHPAVIGATMGETNELYGLPAETQTEVYQYRAQRIKDFPNIDQVQNAYFGIDQNDSAALAKFKDANPDLEKYWSWRRDFAAQYPKASPYILSDQSLSNAIQGVGTVPADAKQALDEYKAQKEKQYPGIDAEADAYGVLAAGSAERTAYLKSHPELPEYWTWKRQFASDHPTAATYILGETGVSQAISGVNRQVPLDLQPVLDYFYNERDQQFPGITDTESNYFNVAAGAQRRAYLAQHPELQQYWDWRSMFEASAPEITMYTRSSQWLSNKILPAAQRQQVLAKATPMLANQLMALATKQGTLGAGGQMELQRLWQEAGQPMGDFETFVKALTGG